MIYLCFIFLLASQMWSTWFFAILYSTCSCWTSVHTTFPSFLPFLSPSSRCQSSNGASEPGIIGGGSWLNMATHLSIPVHNWDVFSEQVMSVKRAEWDLSHSRRLRLSLCFLCALFPALLRDLCHFLSAGKKKTKWEMNEDGACHRERAG